MRLAAIERPRSLKLRIAYWFSRRQLGGVMSPLRVIYARAPHLFGTSIAIYRAMRKLSLDPALRLLVTTQSSLLNACTFCADLHRAEAVAAKLGRERFRDLLDFAHSPHFSERERAALAWTEEITRSRKASDASFERLRAHFSEREIVELTWLNAVGNFYNLLAVPLELESDGFEEIALRRREARLASG
jgi:AhpD family alkylhydroperoxidase